MPTIAVVDYGASNLKSIARGLERAGATVVIASSPEEMAGADGLALPGVGAAGAALQGLRSRGLLDPLCAALKEGRPFLGICLGMQLLFNELEEDSQTGLGIIPGRVRRLQDVKVPHMGWNTVDTVAVDEWPLSGQPLAGLPFEAHVYFVHSYYVELDSSAASIAVGTTLYGERFVSAIARDNIWGTQFHPEKSGENGAQVLRNFVHQCEMYSKTQHRVAVPS